MLFEAYVMLLCPELPMAALSRILGEQDARLWRIVRRHVREARARVDMSNVTSVVVDEPSRAMRRRYVSRFLAPKHLYEDGEVVQDTWVLFATDGRARGTFRSFVSDLEIHGGTATNVRDACRDMSPRANSGHRKRCRGRL